MPFCSIETEKQSNLERKRARENERKSYKVRGEKRQKKM